MRSSFGWSLVLCVLAAGCGGTELKPGPMPDEGSFTGVYFSPQYGEMHMVQNGNSVIGKYKKDERKGTIQGQADGDLLRFEWVESKAMIANRPQETRGHGYFRYMIDPANGDHVLKGRWGLGDDATDGGEWNAYKSRKLKPDLNKFGDMPTSGGENPSGASEDKSGGDQGAADDGAGDDSGGDNKGSGDDGDDIF